MVYRESAGTVPAGSGPPGAPETAGSSGGLLQGPAPQRQKGREAGTMPWSAGAFSAFWAGWSPPHLSPPGLRPVPGEENSKPQGGDLGPHVHSSVFKGVQAPARALPTEPEGNVTPNTPVRAGLSKGAERGHHARARPRILGLDG